MSSQSSRGRGGTGRGAGSMKPSASDPDMTKLAAAEMSKEDLEAQRKLLEEFEKTKKGLSSQGSKGESSKEGDLKKKGFLEEEEMEELEEQEDEEEEESEVVHLESKDKGKGPEGKVNLLGLGLLSVAGSLERMKATPELMKLIEASKGLWADFGKKNSHILRTKLFRLFAAEKMSVDAIFMMYFLHAAIKDCDRISGALDTLPAEFQGASWMSEVKNFIKKRMVKLVKNETSSTFASVHLPGTNPGVDILCSVLQSRTPTNMESLRDLMTLVLSRQTMAQMDIDANLQGKNKQMVRDYWDSIVVLKDTEERKKSKREIGFQENYYETQAKDKYLFVDRSMSEIEVSGVTEELLMRYIAAVHKIPRIKSTNTFKFPKDDSAESKM